MKYKATCCPLEDAFPSGWASADAAIVTGHMLPVVCDSPRDRELDHCSRLQVRPDLGHFQLAGSTPNSLDSFGNLEVSPPVTVRGRRYPFGRIVFGGRESATTARRRGR